MIELRQRLCPILCVLVAATAQRAPAAEPALEKLAFYETKALPVLRKHCFQCHSHASGKARGGLVLDSRKALLTGGDSGAAIEPHDIEQSLLIGAIRYESDDLQMPPAGKMPDEEISVLIEWVRQGAAAPETNGLDRPTAPRSTTTDHWAYQPLRPAQVASSLTKEREVIDSLIERARTRAGVESVGAADRASVIRRLYLDLIGLPPTPEELTAVMSDESTDTLETLVNRLLAMPEFGERWGRHWLDVARYADSNGCSIESNNTYDNAWRYRDYVIAAWNSDKPYDQFVTEQIAGDLLEYVSSTERCDQLIATGFLLLGPKAFGTSSFEQLWLDVADEQIDTMGKAMLGLSLGCARCHDHKFDPISTKDYYALAGIFGSTESVRKAKGWRQGKSWSRVKLPVLDSEAETALEEAYERTKKEAESGELKKRAEEQLRLAKAEMKKLKGSDAAAPESMERAAAAIAVAEREMKNAANMATVLPVISPVPAAMAVVDKESPKDESVRVRGEPENRGDLVPRRVPPIFGEYGGEISTEESGRRQLAAWLVDAESGAGNLLARVAVNRIWGHLFARPLVMSADNFGVTGELPSHPELLDRLAATLINSGWSMKTLIREIVLTKAYGLAAADDSENLAKDPANIWLWRYEPKRIDVEVLRDSMLAITGQLDRSRGGKTLQHLGLVSLGGDHILLDAPSPYRRRSVYLPIYRDAIGLTAEIDASMGMLSTFDFADPNLMAGLRPQTVVPAQALFMMNGEFVYEQSRLLAKRILEQHASDNNSERIESLTQLVYGRNATAHDRVKMRDFLSEFTERANRAERRSDGEGDIELDRWTSLCLAVFGSNEFLFQD